MKQHPSAHDIRQSALQALADEISCRHGVDEDALGREGWFTAKTMAEQLGMTLDATDKRLRRRLAAGTVERRKEVLNGNKTSFYKVK